MLIRQLDCPSENVILVSISVEIFRDLLCALYEGVWLQDSK